MPLPLHRSASQRCCAAPRNLFRLRPIATLGGCSVGCSDGRRPLSYLSGFGNHLHSEALRGAVPRGQNSPQVCPYGLYAEKLSGTAFTAPRHANKQSWLYRILPSVVHQPWTAIDAGAWLSSFTTDEATTPNQLRWLPPEVVSAGAAQGEGREHTFVEGMTTLAGAGEPSLRAGLGMHVYTATGSMGDSCLVNSDGDMLLVPQQGTLRIRTEFGVLEVEPNEIAVLGRGMKFSVDLVHEPAAEAAEAEEAPLHRGYVLEVYGRHFELPELGPIGSNGLANAADFLHPSASYEERECPEGFTVLNRFAGQLFEATIPHSPYDVVGWTGNYLPYKYDLRKFMCINSVTYDHPDPSIYTVLTCPSEEPGTAVADFVVFPPRWMPAEHTFRPPWFHRNSMSEFMGMIWGNYDAKSAKGGDDDDDDDALPSGFFPGGASLHNTMTPHGPDAGVFVGASAAPLHNNPRFFDEGMAFMFETSYLLKPSLPAPTDDAAAPPPHGAAGADTPQPPANTVVRLDRAYAEGWQPLPKRFDPTAVPDDVDDLEGKTANLVAWRAQEENKRQK